MNAQFAIPTHNVLQQRFLHLLKSSLTGTLHHTECIAAMQAAGDIEYVCVRGEGKEPIREGRVWPAFAETMIGWKRLDQLQSAVEAIVSEDIPGNLIEAGVWRGGAAIFMKTILDLHGDMRSVWLADSFTGAPRPRPTVLPDRETIYHNISFLSASVEEVTENLKNYQVWDERVHLVQGYFKDTLPTLSRETWALVRLDANTYDATMDGLLHLYPQLSPGGFLILDDFGCCPPARQAVEDYRRQHCINAEIQTIDWTGAFWRK